MATLKTTTVNGRKLSKGLVYPKTSSIGTGVISGNVPAGIVGWWDLSTAAKDRGDMLVGGVDFVPADNDFLARTSGAIPGVTSGTLDYPLTVVAYFKTDTTASAYHVLGISDGTNNERLVVYTTGTEAGFFQAGGGSNGNPTASGVTAGRWHIGVFVVASSSSRAVYLDTNTTGATNTTSVTTTGLDQIHAGRGWDGTAEWDGEIGPIWILSGDLSGAGNATIRQEIFNGADPLVAARGVCTLIEHYPMEDASGASFTGNFDLTPSGTPTTTNKVLAVRDKSGGGYHMRATTSPPTYDATAFSNRGGAVFASASSQFLVCESTPVTAAPLQVYAVARSSDTTKNQGVVWVGDKDATADFWDLDFAGNVASDEVRWQAWSGTNSRATASTGYTANTTTLLWSLEASSTYRAVEINGGSQGTDTSSRAPTGADRIALGGWLDSTPSNFLSGSIGFVLLLDTAAITDQALIERIVSTAFAITMS